MLTWNSNLSMKTVLEICWKLTQFSISCLTSFPWAYWVVWKLVIGSLLQKPKPSRHETNYNEWQWRKKTTRDLGVLPIHHSDDYGDVSLRPKERKIDSMKNSINLHFMFLKAFHQEFCRTSKEEKNIQQQFLQLQCVSNVVAVINIQFLKKRYPTEEPKESKKRKTTLFCHKSHKTEANSNPFANTISPD